MSNTATIIIRNRNGAIADTFRAALFGHPVEVRQAIANDMGISVLNVEVVR